MGYIYYIVAILLGLAVGSFLNVLVLRFDNLKSIWKGRSKCPKCKKQLEWVDLVPFFAYFYLGSKCRFCKKPISAQYPVVEALMALIFAAAYWKFGVSVEGLFIVLIASLFVAISAYDIIHLEVPDILSYKAIALALGLVFYRLYLSGDLGSADVYLNYGYAVLIGAGFLGLLVLVSKEKWMGAGDILIGLAVGLVLGFPNIILGLFLAFIIGTIVGLILIAYRKKGFKDAVPFGPFLVAAALITIFWGDKIIDLYLKYLGII